MSHVTPKIIADHVGTSERAVRDNARRHKVPRENLGRLGLRYPIAAANRLIAKVWLKGPLPQTPELANH